MPDRLGQMMNLGEVAAEICAPAGAHLPARRGRAGARATAAIARFADDPHWKDLVLFYEYFHGDNGRGLGASHQTGWTALVALMLTIWGGKGAEPTTVPA